MLSRRPDRDPAWELTGIFAFPNGKSAFLQISK